MSNPAGEERARQALARARRHARPTQIYNTANALFALQWRDFAAFLIFAAKWIALASVAGVLAGTASWIFLTSLAWATATRIVNPMLLYALPVVGFGMGWLYYRFGDTSSLGNNLVIEEVNSNRSQIPTRMAPLVLLGTVVTHLCGGSAGREGTAIQMGASLADRVRRVLGLTGEDRRLLLMAGISGGFGSVFGVPVAGFVFGMEVQGVGRVRYDGLIPCIVASFMGDFVARALGTPHAHYPALGITPLEPLLLLKVIVAGIAFGLTSLAFIELTHGVKYLVDRFVTWSPLYPVVGGVAVILLTWLVGTRDYLGLSLPLIVESVEGGDVAPWAFALKTLFTGVTLGTGYLGGEVTPLFVIGSTLGNALGGLLQVDPGLLASIGLVAVFAGASNTPLACALMGVELFGSAATPYLFLGCVVAYLASGHRGIYMTQRVYQTKTALEPSGAATLPEADNLNLRDLRATRGGGWLPKVGSIGVPLQQQPASTLMTKEIITIHEGDSLRDVIISALQSGVRGLPVINAQKQVVGMVTEHDVEQSPLHVNYHQLQLLTPAEREAYLERAATIPVMLVQSTPAITLSAQATIDDALRVLRTMEIKRLPLVNAQQQLAGMLTRSDILRHLLYTDPTQLQHAADGATRVCDVELEPALTVPVDLPLSQYLLQLRTTLTRHAIVSDADGKAIGMISESDLFTRTTPTQRAALRQALQALDEGYSGEELTIHMNANDGEAMLSTITVGELMTTPLIAVQPDDDTSTAMRLLLENQIKRLPVITVGGKILGLLDRRTLLYGLIY